MKKLFLFVTMLSWCWANAQEKDLAFLSAKKTYSDTRIDSAVSKPSSIMNSSFADFNVENLFSTNKQVRKILGYSANGKPIEMYYFPGKSSMKALVIGGVHGSELSSLEVAKQLIRELSKGEKPYYSVAIIPALFPDNVFHAECADEKRVAKNIGRYTHTQAIDPNRQLPGLAQPFLLDNPVDGYGRTIEKENALLLQFIQAYQPSRIISIHAIKDVDKAGIYADPRTDCEGRALGFESDSALAIMIAKHIDHNDGTVSGNNLKTFPTALYYLDPKAALPGEVQQRNLTGMAMTGKINGVSLGSWASTAVCDESNDYYRDAIRMFTMEFPGYKKPSEYKLTADKTWCQKQIELYASSIQKIFLQSFFVEDHQSVFNSMATR